MPLQTGWLATICQRVAYALISSALVRILNNISTCTEYMATHWMARSSFLSLVNVLLRPGIEGCDAMTRDEQDIYSRPGHLIRRLQQIAVAIFVEETADFEITPVQYSALLAVRNHQGIDQTALMNIIAFDRSTIGDVVKRLENKHLIRRATSASDRRTKLLYITQLGRRLLSKVKKSVGAAQDQILAPLSRQERVEFMRMMSKLVQLNNDHSRVPLRLNMASMREVGPAKFPLRV